MTKRQTTIFIKFGAILCGIFGFFSLFESIIIATRVIQNGVSSMGDMIWPFTLLISIFLLFLSYQNLKKISVKPIKGLSLVVSLILATAIVASLDRFDLPIIIKENILPVLSIVLWLSFYLLISTKLLRKLELNEGNKQNL